MRNALFVGATEIEVAVVYALEYIDGRLWHGDGQLPVYVYRLIHLPGRRSYALPMVWSAKELCRVTVVLM